MKKYFSILMAAMPMFAFSPVFAVQIDKKKNQRVNLFVEIKAQKALRGDTPLLILQATKGMEIAQDELMKREHLGAIFALKPKTICFLEWNDIFKRCCANPHYASYAIKNNIKVPGLFTRTIEEANQGILAAQNNLGELYKRGQMSEGKSAVSDALAIKWYRIAAMQGHANAQYNLGLIYEEGRGVGGTSPENDAIAVHWYTEAAKQGHIKAQNNFGRLYASGRGVGGKTLENDKIALKCYRQAATQGHPGAQNNLGLMYASGRGVKAPSDIKAMKYYKKGAKRGSAAAQNNLANMYREGRVVGEQSPENDRKALRLYTKAAEKGLASAQYNLGRIHEEGRGVGGPSKENFEVAIEWYTKAAKQGYVSAKSRLKELGREVGEKPPEDDKIASYIEPARRGEAWAQYALGKAYKTNQGIPAGSPDNDKFAVYWYMEAAKQGHTDAQNDLGLMYKKGRGVGGKSLKNDKIAVHWYTTAANRGNVHAQNNLGVMYKKGRGVGGTSLENDKFARYWFHKAVNQGNAHAQYNLGLMYQEGRGVGGASSENDKIAVYLYAQAANQGHIDAQNNFEWMYASGRGVEEIEKILVDSYTKAADQGDSEAQFNLGVLYEKGQGVGGTSSENDKIAVHWYTEAAKQGHIGARNNLGRMYAKGRGVGSSFPETDKIVIDCAIDWYAQAAEQGDMDAQYNLGMRYYNGEGVEKDLSEAVRLYTLAANQGHAAAQSNLAGIYYNGEGVEQNLIEALHWAIRSRMNSRKRFVDAHIIKIANFSCEKGSFQKTVSEVLNLPLCQGGDAQNSIFSFVQNLWFSILGEVNSPLCQDGDAQKTISSFVNDLLMTYQMKRGVNAARVGRNMFTHPFLYTAYNFLEEILASIRPVISSFTKVKPGFMINVVKLSEEIEKQLPYQIIPFFSYDKLEDGSSYLTLGEDNVVIVGRFMKLLTNLDEVDKKLEQLSLGYTQTLNDTELKGEDFAQCMLFRHIDCLSLSQLELNNEKDEEETQYLLEKYFAEVISPAQQMSKEIDKQKKALHTLVTETVMNFDEAGKKVEDLSQRHALRVNAAPLTGEDLAQCMLIQHIDRLFPNQLQLEKEKDEQKEQALEKYFAEVIVPAKQMIQTIEKERKSLSALINKNSEFQSYLQQPMMDIEEERKHLRTLRKSIVEEIKKGTGMRREFLEEYPLLK